jgi:hypothetical protein
MNTIFMEWLASRDIRLAIRLLEQTHDKAAYNQLFSTQLDSLLRRVKDRTQRKQLEAMREFDWMADIEKALRRASFAKESEELGHDIVVKLLVSPGGLFSGWKGQPLLARFRASVKNAIASIIEKRQTRRRLIPTVGFDPAVAYLGAPPPSHALLAQEFQDFLRARYGELHARVLHHRLSGGETRELFGRAGSRYEVKQVIRDIKTAAKDFASRSGDPAFVNMVKRAMAGERETVEKRRKAAGVG